MTIITHGTGFDAAERTRAVDDDDDDNNNGAGRNNKEPVEGHSLLFEYAVWLFQRST